MVASTSRRGARIRRGFAALLLAVTAAVGAVGGQIAAGGAARAESAGGPCPCSIFPATSVPDDPDSGTYFPVVLGVKVVPSSAGWIQGVRFYKASANTGTHTGSLWTSDGTLLATGTFTNETASGWQTLMFQTPVPVRAGATYVASYYAPNGHYAYSVGYFLNGPAGPTSIVAPSDSAAGGNGVYSDNGAAAFPNSSYNAANYWVDVIYDDGGVPTAPPTVTSHTPADNATQVPGTTPVSATFSAPVDSSSVQFSLTDASGTRIPGTIGYSADFSTVTFTPGTQLLPQAVYTASVQAADAWGNAMSGPSTWSFTVGTAPPPYTCPCSLFASASTPAVMDSTDPNSVELGVRFVPAVNGSVTGIRFYKGATNTGTHTGTLWSNTGTALATGTFANETASGWQTMTFANPVSVTAGTTYVASYHAPVGHYSYTTGYFSYAHQDYPLTAPANTSSQGDGTYDYGSSTTFPGAGGNGNNYWVDVVFSAS